MIEAMVSFTEDLEDFDYTARQNTSTGMSSEYDTRKQGGTGKQKRVRRKRTDSNRMEEGVI